MVRGVTLDLAHQFPDSWQWPSSAKGIDLASSGVELVYDCGFVDTAIPTLVHPVVKIYCGKGMHELKGWLN